MAYARSAYQKGVGSNLIQHAEHNADLGGKERQSNTFKSNIAFSAFQPTQDAVATSSNNQNRNRQFVGNPVQPPATRQSYQDSDIFGNKSNPNTVQPNQFSPKKEGKMRQSNTFARSNVLGQDDGAVKMGDGQIHKAISTRKEGKWESSVFKGPIENVSTRKRLEQEGAGKEGLYGDTEGSNTWQKKENFAAQLSQKAPTRPPQFNDQAAEMRKAREIYGEGYRPNKQPVFPKEGIQPGINSGFLAKPAENRFATKDRKAGNLQSQVLTHDNDDVRYQRKGNYAQENTRIQSASNAGWNSQTGYAKPNNTSNVDPYKRRQNELSSGVLEQTDYTKYAPLAKKQVDMDNIDRDQEVRPSNATKPSPKKSYQMTQQKQGQLQSSLDDHGYTPQQQKWAPQDDYEEKNSVPIPNKTVNGSKKQAFLASTFTGHDALKYYEKQKGKQQEVIDIDITGLPENCDEIRLKKAANVKHVISTEISYDNFLGKCKGDGRIKIRLNDGETTEQVRANLIRAGFQVKHHTEDPRKKPNMTGVAKKQAGDAEMGRVGMSAKEKKMFEMQTKAPVVF